jgi:2-polyprenyl-3-methyl-5-hydroxy-6-metoxy-1,4-benzoquinol methylase/Tfp pilus assembly protein PilF
MMATPRILTFNFHEPYLCMMAETGLPFDVGLYESGNFARVWQHIFRPAPKNLTFITEAEWRQRVKAGYYDVVIAQNETNAVDAADGDAARLLICHNRRTFLSTTIQKASGGEDAYAEVLDQLRDFYDFVYISESKRDDYGIPGRVILPGIDVDAWGGYRGETSQIIRVGNTMRQRDLMFDVDFQEACCGDLPCRVVGTNPLIPGSAPTTSVKDLLEVYRSNRCLLHVSRAAYEDGYNLAMLEAMAIGMPVVSLANKTSPISDGQDGFASYDSDVLRGRLKELLENQDLAREIGARGRDTVADKFPLSRFTECWRSAILEAADKNSCSATPPVNKPTQAQRVGVPILVSYVASPHTTGRYIREAIRQEHSVASCGMQIPDSTLIQWGFKHPIPEFPTHEFQIGQDTTPDDIQRRLPAGFNPAMLLWVDSGQATLEKGLAELDIPKAAWFIDTHIATAHRIEIARQMDFVYLAQRGQIQEFLDAGIKHVRWLPLGCGPEIHNTPRGELEYDVAFVGSVASASGDNRRQFIEAVREQFPNHYIGQCWPHEMGEAYARAKIVVNMCLNDDVNMRVFEAMASGALLITDNADGLKELFADGEELVVYRDVPHALELIAKYLENDDARERIARAGRERVHSDHTYARRIQTMLEDIEKTTGSLSVPLRHHDAKSVEGYYQHPRRELLQAIPTSARRILDVGCGAGALGKLLLEERGAEEVCGIEFMEEAYQRALGVLNRVILGNIEELALPFEDGYFDCIICADVLEHLVDPEAVLRKLDRVLAPHGVIVISIPNARNYEVLQMLATGRWAYQEQGIMDATHLRFFTRIDLIKMIEASGMKAADVIPLNSRPAERLPKNDDGSVTVGNIVIENVSDADYRELLTYQHLGIACKKDWDYLETANQAMDAGEYDVALNLALDGIGGDEFVRMHIVARAYGRLGDLQKAAEVYESLLEQTDAPHIAGDYGVLLVAMNQPARARPMLELALAKEPSLDRIEGALGLVDLQEGNHEAAFVHIRQAMLANYDHKGLADALLDLAQALKRIEEALPVLAEYVEFYPGNLDLKTRYAEALAELGQSAEARAQLETVLIFDPGHERARALQSALDSDTPTST